MDYGYGNKQTEIFSTEIFQPALTFLREQMLFPEDGDCDLHSQKKKNIYRSKKTRSLKNNTTLLE